MKIALIGYGRMGQAIEKLAIKRGHRVSMRIDKDSDQSINDISSENTDVIIEFTNPEVAYDNLHQAVQTGVPCISGTTGWLDRYHELCNEVNAANGAFLYASNFSIGVNLFFALNQHLAKLMSAQADYAVSMEEIHHIHKLDAPSGTAITLAEQIIDQHSAVQKWINDRVEDDDTIGIVSKRAGEVAGTHSIRYESDIDQITITHEAFSRQGFALGAVMAAEWLQGKSGIYTMTDVLSLK